MLRPDPLPLIIQEAPPDQGNRGSDEDHECPARGSPPDVERNNKGCHRPRGRAIPLKHGPEQFAHTVPISSRPINIRRISFVPAPISSSLASRTTRSHGGRTSVREGRRVY